jgi:hypothetical protein
LSSCWVGLRTASSRAMAAGESPCGVLLPPRCGSSMRRSLDACNWQGGIRGAAGGVASAGSKRGGEQRVPAQLKHARKGPMPEARAAAASSTRTVAAHRAQHTWMPPSLPPLPLLFCCHQRLLASTSSPGPPLPECP